MVKLFNILLLAIPLLFATASPFQAPETKKEDVANARKARELFDYTYKLAFGPQGCTLRYDVNIIGIYKTAGIVFYKGKKMRYNESRYHTWNDGVTDYMVDTKKKTVTIYRSDDPKKEGYLSKFTYSLDNFKYSWKDSKEGYIISLKLRNAHLTGIREVRALVDKRTRYPLKLRIKVAFFWTTVKISNFQSGNISDSLFIFPAEKFKGYKYIDKRKNN